MRCVFALWTDHDVGHPYMVLRDGSLCCLRCYVHNYERPVIAPNHGPREVLR